MSVAEPAEVEVAPVVVQEGVGETEIDLLDYLLD